MPGGVERGLPPRAQRQVAPSDAPAPADDVAQRQVALSEVVVHEAAPSAGRLRVCTLNLGGRNTNSFEFIMAGDSSGLGAEWQRRYDTASHAITELGPGDFPGLPDAVSEAISLVAPGSTADETITALLACPTWTAMLASAKAKLPKLFNVLNLTTIKAGRPSPLESPDNVKPDAELLPQWQAWLQQALPKGHASWESRLTKKGFTAPLATCVAALLLFDAMCAHALQVASHTSRRSTRSTQHPRMHAHLAHRASHAPRTRTRLARARASHVPQAMHSDESKAGTQLRPFVEAMIQHLVMHASLPFTSYQGKVRRGHPF